MPQQPPSQTDCAPPTDTQGLKRPRKYSRWLVIILVVVAGAVVGGPFLLNSVGGWIERRQSYNILAAAADRDALVDAVGRLGVLLDLPDGEWIAIRYRDSHGWPGYSIAVALTSDDRWLESTHHFCGKFIGYKHYRGRLQEATTEGERDIYEASITSQENLHRLWKIERQATLDQAIDELRAMHFSISPDTRPTNMANPTP